MLVSDVWHAPELIPGVPDLAYGSTFSFRWKDDSETRKSFYEWLFGAMCSIFFFVPAILWRWSIKSTAWFYISLLWVRRGWLTHTGEDLHIWAQSYSRKVINWLWLILGGLSFIALGVSLFSLEKWLAMKQATDDANAPMTFIGFLSSLNWADLLTQPWMWFYIPSYALTIYLFFELDGIAADIRAGAAPDSRLSQIAGLKWAANARTVLTNIGLALALGYFLTAAGAWGHLRSFMKHLF